MALDQGELRLESVGLTYRFTKSLQGGVDAAALRSLPLQATADAFKALLETGESKGMNEAVWWPRLGDDAGNGVDSFEAAKAWGKAAHEADLVISVGIGGSYLGNRVLRDALFGTRAQALPRELRGGPVLHFAGHHLDPLEARQLIDLVKAQAPKRVALLAISKSGTTTETLATTLSLIEALREAGHPPEFAALTAPGSVLADLVEEFEGTLIPFPDGMGGRWSVLSSVGVSTAAATGVDVDALLQGARDARTALLESSPEDNPALVYAAVHHLHAAQGRRGAVFMPYSERLRSISDWYVQLLAESLGKAENRAGETVYAGRTPIVAVGTTDMHAQTQLHQAGPQDKTVTTLDLLDWGETTNADRVPERDAAGKLKGKRFAELNTLAREANEEALAGDGRPSDTWLLDRLDARTLGALLYTLMATVAYEGELLDVCAYDQPGVEAYKSIMRARLP